MHEKVIKRGVRITPICLSNFMRNRPNVGEQIFVETAQPNISCVTTFITQMVAHMYVYKAEI